MSLPSKILVGMGITLLIILYVVYFGWVIQYLWLWFVVPLGVPLVSIPQALGLTLVAAALTGFKPVKPFKDPTKIIAMILSPIMALGLGYFLQYI